MAAYFAPSVVPFHITSEITSRLVVKWVILLSLICLSINKVGLMASEPENVKTTKNYSFERAYTPNELHHVKSTIVVEGHLKLNAKGKEITKVPLAVQGELQYDEKILQDSSKDHVVRHSIRDYKAAKAHIKMKNGAFDNTLPAGRQLIAAKYTGGKIELLSPQGAMTRDVLELLEVQGDPLLFPSLLPSEDVAVGGKWKPSLDLLAPFFGWEAISKNEAEGELVKVQGHILVLELGGKVTGHIGGVPARANFKARYHYHLKSKRITGFSMAILEDRSIGHAEPGFSIKTEVRTSVSALKQSRALDDSALEKSLAKWPLDFDSKDSLLLRLASSHGFEVLYEQDWRIMVDRPDTTVLRYVHKGDLIAQCNISKLKPLPAGRQLPLSEFQADIQNTLKDHFEQFIEASQSTTEDGIRVLRVTAAGVVNKLPIQWTYYHLSEASGRRAAFVFTMEQKLVEKFAGADQVMISSFRFLDQAAPRAASRP